VSFQTNTKTHIQKHTFAANRRYSYIAPGKSKKPQKTDKLKNKLFLHKKHTAATNTGYCLSTKEIPKTKYREEKEMKKINGLTRVGVLVVAVAMLSVTAFAASAYSNPAEAVAGLSGRDLEGVIAERHESGEPYGTIAENEGILEAFEAEMLQIRKDIIAKRVAEGKLTQEKANEVIAAMEEHAAACDGECSEEEKGSLGQSIGGMFGGMSGKMGGGLRDGSGINADGETLGQGSQFGGRMGGSAAARGLGQAQAS
jgi:hypothetical protein